MYYLTASFLNAYLSVISINSISNIFLSKNFNILLTKNCKRDILYIEIVSTHLE